MLYFRRLGKHGVWLRALITVALSASMGRGQDNSAPPEEWHSALKVSTSAPADRLPQPAHPLESLIDTAMQYQQRIRQEIVDYTCYLVKRERIDGELLEPEHMFIKFRAHMNSRTDSLFPSASMPAFSRRSELPIAKSCSCTVDTAATCW